MSNLQPTNWVFRLMDRETKEVYQQRVYEDAEGQHYIQCPCCDDYIAVDEQTFLKWRQWQPISKKGEAL